MKKLISILLVTALIVSCMATFAFAAGNPVISGNHVTAKRGGTATVTFKVDEMTYQDYGMFITYDKSVLTIVSIDAGSASHGTFGSNIKNGKVATFDSGDATVSGTLFTVTFQVSENAAFNTPYTVGLSIDSVRNDADEYLSVDVAAGSVTIVCEHNYTGWSTVKEATCTETGLKTNTCSICGDVMEEVIPTVDHKYGEWSTVKEATCTETGLKVKTCSVCGDKIEEVIPTVDHKYGEWFTVKEATCTETGLKVKTCSVCGDKIEEVIPTVDHKYGDWEIVKAATCTEDGLKERTCSVCGEKQTEVIPSSEGHEWGEWTVIKEATCTEDGERTRKCSACGEEQTEVIPATGHVWAEEWTTDETHHWHVCTVCGEKCEHNGEHTFGDWTVTKEAGNTENGEKVRTCSVCSYEQTETIPATGDPTDPPKTGDPTILMVGGISILLLLLIAALYYIKRKASSAK